MSDYTFQCEQGSIKIYFTASKSHNCDRGNMLIDIHHIAECGMTEVKAKMYMGKTEAQELANTIKKYNTEIMEEPVLTPEQEEMKK